MTDRRRWKEEEKLAIMKVKEKGRVVETCREYFVNPCMYYKWKGSYDTFGLDNLKSHFRKMEESGLKIRIFHVLNNFDC